MLIIDEPEVGLHPNAIRAASDYLYALADDPSWQVMLATHSPASSILSKITRQSFAWIGVKRTPARRRIVPIQPASPKMKKKGTQDAESFRHGAGGNVLWAVFDHYRRGYGVCRLESIMAKHPEDFPLSRNRSLFAKGQIHHASHHSDATAIQGSLCDTPRHRLPSTTRWENEFCIDCQSGDLQRDPFSREAGVKVVHRVSLPNIELAHLQIPYDDTGFVLLSDAKDKPWKVFNAIREKEEVEQSLMHVLVELTNPDADPEPFNLPYEESLNGSLVVWAKEHAPEDPRFIFAK